MNEVVSFVDGSVTGCSKSNLNYPPFTPGKSVTRQTSNFTSNWTQRKGNEAMYAQN